MATPIRHWIQRHVSEPIERMYERVEADLGLDPELADEILASPDRHPAA